MMDMRTKEAHLKSLMGEITENLERLPATPYLVSEVANLSETIKKLRRNYEKEKKNDHQVPSGNVSQKIAEAFNKSGEGEITLPEIAPERKDRRFTLGESREIA